MNPLMEAYVVIKASLSPLRSALSAAKSAVSKAVGTMEAAFKKLYNISKKVALAIAAYLGIATYKAVKQEKAVLTLAAALKTTGDYSEKSMKQFKEYAAAIQKVTVYGDEDILMQMAYAKNLGVTTDKLKDATKAAIGLAAKYELDLQTAFMLIGRAAKGQTQMLTRYGIVLGDNLSSQEKFNKLLVIGAKAFQLAEAAADTTRGRLTQMKNAMGDIAEIIGEPLRRRLKDWAERTRDWAYTHQESIKRITDAFDRLLTVGTIVVRELVKPLMEWFGKLTDKFAHFEAEAKLTKALWAVGEWVDKLVVRIKAAWDFIKELWRSDSLSTAIGYALDLALEQVIKWGKQLFVAFKGIAKIAGEAFVRAIKKPLLDLELKMLDPQSILGKILGYTPLGMTLRIAAGAHAITTMGEEATGPRTTLSDIRKSISSIKARSVPVPSSLEKPFINFRETIKREDANIKAKWQQIKEESSVTKAQKDLVKKAEKAQEEQTKVAESMGKIGFIGLREAWQQLAVGLTLKKKDPNTDELKQINKNTYNTVKETKALSNKLDNLYVVGP